MNISNQGIASNLLYGILLCTASSQAIPLHNGNSWKWEVTDYNTRTSRIVETAVFDSTVTDSGTIWTIRRIDFPVYLKIIQTKEGKQGWLRGNGTLPWEPSPYDSLKPRQFEPWGIQAWRSAYTEPASYFGNKSTLGMFDDYGVSHKVSSPSCIWSDSLGVERFRFQNIDWRMIEFHGRPTNLARDTLLTPDSGSVFEWDFVQINSINSRYGASSNSIESRLRWEILSNSRDSGEWSLVKMRARWTSNNQASDSLYVLRLNRKTKERIPPNPLPGEAPDAAWWKDWTETPSPQVSQRHQLEETTRDGYLTHTKLYSTMTISTSDRAMTSYSLDIASTRAYNGGEATSISYTLRSSETLPLASRRRIHNQTNPGLLEISTIYPDLEIRWMDGKGRSGTVLAREMRRLEARKSLTPIYLSATLPNGKPWTGSTMGFIGR